MKKAGYTKDFVLEHVAIFDVDKNVTSVTLNDKPVKHYYVEKSKVSPGGEIRGNGKILFAHVSAIAGWASFSRALFPSSASPQTSSAAGEQGCCSGWMKVEGALEAFPLLSCGSLCPRSDHAKKKTEGKEKGQESGSLFSSSRSPTFLFRTSDLLRNVICVILTRPSRAFYHAVFSFFSSSLADAGYPLLEIRSFQGNGAALLKEKWTNGVKKSGSCGDPCRLRRIP